MSIVDFTALVSASLPVRVHRAIEARMRRARELGALVEPLAPKFDDAEAESIRRSLVLAWAHSRDVSMLASALGYPLDVTGQHDVEEPLPVEIVRRQVEKTGREVFSPWFLAYVDGVEDGSTVDVGVMNPHFLVDAYRWRPGTESRDWVVVHRLSGHHRGNSALPLDPIEGAVNHVQHRREHRLGIRKAATMTFEQLDSELRDPKGALRIARSELGVAIARDAVPMLERLEREGLATPWWLVDPES